MKNVFMHDLIRLRMEADYWRRLVTEKGEDVILAKKSAELEDFFKARCRAYMEDGETFELDDRIFDREGNEIARARS